MARIYLDARAANSTTSGVGRYCDALVDALVCQSPHHEYIVIAGPDVSARMASRGTRCVTAGGRGSVGLALSRPQLGRALRSYGQPDLYHALFHIVPFGIRVGAQAPTRIVVTLHDLIWIDHARAVASNAVTAAWRKTLGSSLIPYALGIADHVICNSDATAKSAARWLSPERRTVVHMGVGQAFLSSSASESGAMATTAPPYITAFGVPKPYKNIVCLVRALHTLRRGHPNVRLVLLGGDGGARAETARLGLQSTVEVRANVSDADVRSLIRGAQVHVVPSLVEGFGLPVIEAMALGTPVLTSDAPALREVAADAAPCFPATDPAALASALSMLLSDASLRGALSDAGRERASHFTWSRTAAETLAVYDRVLATSSPRL